MNRSEFSANFFLAGIPRPSWTDPAPVRAVKRVSLIVRLVSALGFTS